MKVWIAGKGGLLAGALVHVAKHLKIEFLATSRQELDISDLASLEAWVHEHPGITHIVNAAALSAVDVVERERDTAWRVNALGPENLGKIAHRIKAKLIHISTDYVFPGDGNRPICEDDPQHPLNYYGVTKQEGERKVLAVLPSVCILRTSSIFGDGGKNIVARLKEMFAQGKSLSLTNDQWVRPTYALDLAQAIFHVFAFFQSGIYHYANRGVATKFLFGSKMKEMMEAQGSPPLPSIKEASVHDFPTSCARPVYCVFDTRKFETTFQMSIRSWEDALFDFLVPS